MEGFQPSPFGLQADFIGQGLRIKDFKQFVSAQSERIKAHAKAMAERAERPYVYLNGPVRKEQRARAMAERDKIVEGLTCVLGAVEGCQSFKIAYGERRPQFVPARRKCLCLYLYFMDREFGLLHMRISTWFPFTVQGCLNGHDWLASKMDQHDIAYHQLNNAFLWIEEPQRAGSQGKSADAELT